MRTAIPFVLAILVGCVGPPARPVEAEWADQLHSSKAEERTQAFQNLLRRGPEAAPALKAALMAGGRYGHPAAALLYALGEGDAVPLEARARHLAAFRWPAEHDAENAVVEAYAWREVERDLLRDGRPAVRVLAAALERDAPSEAKALQAARVLLRLGRREVGDALWAMLETERDLGGVRVCDVAAGALLFLGRQEGALRQAAPGERLRRAKEWWSRAKDRPESDWTREAVGALAAGVRPKDPDGVRSVLELLTGETIDDAAAWAERNREWAPASPPLRPEALLAELGGTRAKAFRANDLLEQSTGVRVWLPRWTSLGELLAAIRLWNPPEDLAVRWKRHLGGTLLRLSLSAVGYHPKKDAPGILWNRDSYFHATEEASDEFRVGRDEGYVLYAQACELGTRLVVNEFVGRADAGFASLREASALRPWPVFSGLLKACVVVSVEEVGARGLPRAPEAVAADVRRALRRGIEGVPEGIERRKLLRALAYFQDPEDLDVLRERKAGEGLLLLGDPAALDLAPRLVPYEIEMALRKAEDPRVKEYLERLRAER